MKIAYAEDPLINAAACWILALTRAAFVISFLGLIAAQAAKAWGFLA